MRHILLSGVPFLNLGTALPNLPCVRAIGYTSPPGTNHLTTAGRRDSSARIFQLFWYHFVFRDSSHERHLAWLIWQLLVDHMTSVKGRDRVQTEGTTFWRKTHAVCSRALPAAPPNWSQFVCAECAGVFYSCLLMPTVCQPIQKQGRMEWVSCNTVWALCSDAPQIKRSKVIAVGEQIWGFIATFSHMENVALWLPMTGKKSEGISVVSVDLHNPNGLCGKAAMESRCFLKIFIICNSIN